jgi:hypothetical protein
VVFPVNPTEEVPPSPFTRGGKQKLVLSQNGGVQKLSNPEYYCLWYVKSKWQDITQTGCKLITVIQFLKNFKLGTLIKEEIKSTLLLF